MFSSNPLDKLCIGPDNCSVRNNASNRFPVGITSLGDENQQIRIQLAVNKYNSSANTPPSNRCAVISPPRHSFLKNSPKAINYEADSEGKSKNSEKRNCNHYEGMGAFPTVHLRKSSIRYRPIRRFNDVKVSYPELPVNRFLSNLPEACPDLKSSTRSVLDVLEDLSGKKIHSKEDSGSSKFKSKGLAGDYHLNSNAMYKPLFVQKPKISSVLTRDNTTQTLSPSAIEKSPDSQSSNLSFRNDSSDPRAELRRKLAKQNNEIFASLSSSISSFSLKRKIDKILPTRDDGNLPDESVMKKSKTSDHQPNNYNGHCIPKSAGRLKISSRDSIRNKTKLRETSSPTSPNKDRLTTIFLDMQVTGQRVQMFEKNSMSTKMQNSKDGSQVADSLDNEFTHTTNSLLNKTANPTVNVSENGSKKASATEIGKDCINNSSLSFVEKSALPEIKKTETEEFNKPMINFPMSKVETTPSNIMKLPPMTFQFGINTSTSNFNFPKTSVESSALSNDDGKTLGNGNTTVKKDDENHVLNKTFTLESSLTDKPDFSSFKFGENGSAALALNKPLKDLRTQISEAPSVSATAVPTVTPQFSLGTTSNTSASPSQSSAVQLCSTNAQNTSITPSKLMFSFGQNAIPSQENSNSTKVEDKTKGSNNLPVSTTTTPQSLQPGAFILGQKSAAETLARDAASTVGPLTQTSSLTFSSPSASCLSTSTGFALHNTKSLFTFGQKTETFTTSTAVVTSAQEQKSSLNFDQKPDAERNKVQGKSEQKTTNLFSFGQKPVAQDSQMLAASASVTSPSQSVTTQSAPTFGQNVSPPNSTSGVKFNQVSAPQISNSFGAKSEGGPSGNISAPAFNQGNSALPVKSPLFGTSTNTFGNNTSQASPGFGTSTSTGSNLGFAASATTQPTPTFNVSSAPTSTPVFKNPSTAQSGFGGPNVTHPTPAFGSSLSSGAPTFGVSTTMQSTSNFPISSTTQPRSSFGATSTTQSIPTFGTAPTSLFGITSTTQSTSTFGVSSASQCTPTFGVSTNESLPAFGTSSGFGVSASSQPNTVFGAPNSAQSVVRFGAQENTTFGTSTGFSATSPTQPNTDFGAPGFGVSQPSFSQPFDSKTTTSPRQTTSIFGQNPTASFPSSTAFSSNQNIVFGQKTSTEGSMFDQNKIQAPAFGSTSQTFGAQNKFSFGSTSNTTGFTSSAPNATSAPVFGFGGANTTGTLTFGGSISATSNTQTPFAFKSLNEPFQFGAIATTKEGPGFGGPPTFPFGSQTNNNTMTEQKPTFNFGSTRASAPFAFGKSPSPSVFSFGSSTPASSGSSFNFGTPTPGGLFGQTPTPSPGAPFAVPGTFSIGSGSSQSRPRATSRPRRRP